MLLNECQKTTNLLMEDFNIQLVFAENACLKKLYTDKSQTESVWKEYMRDTLGEVINSSNNYEVECYIVKSEEVEKLEEATLPGNKIIKHFWEKIKDADGIKFTLTQANGRIDSYVIVR